MGAQPTLLIWIGWYCLVGTVLSCLLALYRPRVRRQIEQLGAYGRGPQIAGCIALIVTWPGWVPTRLYRLAVHLIHESEIVTRCKRAFAMSRELEDQMKALGESDSAVAAEIKGEFKEAREDYDRTIAMVVKCSGCRKKLEKLGIPLPPEERHEWEL